MNASLSFPFACFFCGVDSRVLLYFIIAFVLCVVLASISFLMWAIMRGDFKNVEQVKYEIFNDPEAGLPQAVAVPSLRKSNPPSPRPKGQGRQI